MGADRHKIAHRMVVFETVIMLAGLPDLVSLPFSLLTRSAGHHAKFLETVLLYALNTLRYHRVKHPHSRF